MTICCDECTNRPECLEKGLCAFGIKPLPITTVPPLEGSDKELVAALERVAKLLRERSEPLPPDFQKALYNNLWGLYERPGMCPACKDGGACGCILNVPKVT